MTALSLWAVFAVLGSVGDPAGASAAGTRVVSIATASRPRTVTLEWRRIENGATVLLREQKVTLDGRTAIRVGEGEDVLRVREPGAAPRSFLVPPGTEAASFDLEPPAKGGEVFGRVPRHRFRPSAIRLVSASGRMEVPPDEGGVFEASGLAPGSYLLEPVYRGGAVGRGGHVTVHEGRTVELLALELPDTGAVRLDLALPLCGEPELGLRLDGGALGAHGNAIAPGVCSLEMEGLQPGTWRAIVTRGGPRNEPRAAVDFVVTAGETTDVTLEPVVRVSGTVTAGGAPAAGQRLVFHRSADRWNAVTDARGRYETLLGAPGEYVVSVLAAKEMPSRSFMRTFGPGDHEEDVELGPGTIEVSIRAEGGARLDESVDLALFEARGRRVYGRFNPGDGPALFAGLEYGQYTVTGTTASGLRSRNRASTELSAESPAAQVELRMTRGQGVLRVVGADGVPLAGARASAGQTPLPERAPGVFDLARVPAGERLLAQAPDHVPACRVLSTGASNVDLTLPVAEGTFTLRLRADASWRDLLLIGLPGSDCPVAIDDVQPQVRTEDHLVSIVFDLPRGSFAVALDGVAHEASAPGDLEIP